MSNVLIDCNNVSLQLNQTLYRQDTFKDWFVRASKGNFRHPSNIRDVLKKVHFQVRDGDRVALLGANGAGKSSLCRLITGTLRPTKGRLRTAGGVLGVLDPTPIVQESLTGRENIRILVELLHPNRSDYDALTEEIIAFSELGTQSDAPFNTYSSGMRARTCLSLLSVLPSTIVVLDEVFQGADAGFQTRIATRFRKMLAESQAILFVSHYESELRSLCNRALVLHEGELIYDGGLEQGIETYRKKCRA